MTDKNLAKFTSDALEEWRIAERAAAVLRRGHDAAEAAAAMAADAAEAAIATSEAAKAALASSTLAEASAAKTANSARGIVQLTTADLANSEKEHAAAELDEAAAHEKYRQAVARATDKR
jgi:hypothetical protein